MMMAGEVSADNDEDAPTVTVPGFRCAVHRW
jgi:hypothetical protein